MNTKLLILVSLILTIVLLACDTNKKQSNLNSSTDYSKVFSIPKDILLDKIKGGWAGQVIGCTYGGPTEFKFCGTMIQDYTPITQSS